MTSPSRPAVVVLVSTRECSSLNPETKSHELLEIFQLYIEIIVIIAPMKVMGT